MKPTSLFVSCLAATLAAQAPPMGPRSPLPPDVRIVPKQPGVTPPKAASTASAGPIVPHTEPAKTGLPVGESLLAARLQAAVLFDLETDGTLLAVAADHKAEFRPEGFCFVARPHDQSQGSEPITFTTTGVTVDGEPLPITSLPPQRDGQRIEWHRGSCRERVQVEPRGLEQSFLFTTLPQRGELVVTIGVATTRHGSDRGDGIVFAGRGGDVQYAEAVAIDATGRRIAAPTEFRAGAITIRVPAAFVATAQLPLVIDPLINSSVAYQTTAGIGHSDLAYDEGTQSYMLAFERVFSSDDIDVYCQRLDSTMTPIGAITFADASLDVWSRPRIAGLNAYDRYLVVAQRSVDATGPYSIRGRVLDQFGTMLTAQLDIESQTASSSDKLSPDVGGDSYPFAPSYWTVVFEAAYSPTDHDIGMRQIQFDGTPRAAAATVIQANTFYQSKPRISESNGSPAAQQNACIVYEQIFSAADTDIHGALRTWDGQTPVGQAATFPIDASSISHLRPAVSSPTAGSSREFLVAYEAPFVGNGDIYLSCVDNDALVLASASLTTAENSGAAAWPQYLPCVDCDGVRWAVSYTEVFNGTSGDQDIRTSLVARNGFNLVVHEVRIATAFSASSEFDATCASTYSGSGIPSQAPPAYGIANSRVLAAGGSALDTDLYLGHGGSAGYTVRPTGCGSLDMLSSGLPILGQQFGFLTVQSYPIQAYAFGTPLSVPLPMPGCNGCTAGVDGTLVVGATLSITVPTDASLFGVAFSVQGLAVGGGTCLGNLSLSATYDFLVQ